jgi:hypothetical protein
MSCRLYSRFDETCVPYDNDITHAKDVKTATERCVTVTRVHVKSIRSGCIGSRGERGQSCQNREVDSGLVHFPSQPKIFPLPLITSNLLTHA